MTTIALHPPGRAAGLSSADATVRFEAMASQVTLRVVRPNATAPAALQAAEQVVRRVAASCTRFDPDSALMRANAAGRRWQSVPPECFDAVAAAAAAHRETDGRFDPRVLRALNALGYDRSWSDLRLAQPGLADRPMPGTTPSDRRHLARGAWRPGLDRARGRVRVGTEPIDLGGIGKGLAVAWAAHELRTAGSAAMVEAGGDCQLVGAGPDGTGWLVGVEDPAGGDEPVAVLALSDVAVATSSTRRRRWRTRDAAAQPGAEPAAERVVHHLVDPRTGLPGGPGLAAVTVLGADAATAEVWAKALFLAGRRGIRRLAAERGLAALWVADDGYVGTSAALRPYLAWQVHRAS